MIITKLRLQEENPMTGVSDSWPLPVCDLNLDSSAGENGYILKDSTGLEPPDLNEVVDGFGTTGIPSMLDVPEKREIVLKIGFRPGVGQSYSSLRDELYRYMSRTMMISLIDGTFTVGQAVGYIKRFESALFTPKPEVEITIQCDDGQFSGPSSVPIPLITLDTLTPVINYEMGTAPTGLDLVFEVTVNTSSFNIFGHSTVRGRSNEPSVNQFLVTYPFLAGDVITMTTHPNNRRILRDRGGVVLDLAGYISSGAVWPLLFPRVNSFQWTLASSWMTLVSASYVPKYWGV